MVIEPYLFFPGNCEEALAFYAEILGGSTLFAMRYGDVPPAADHPIPPGSEKKIMHATFVAGDLKFMASDSMQLAPGTAVERVSLSIGTTDVEEGGRVFAALAAGGTVHAPYAKQFWGATFGMLTDRFGIDWMVNAGDG
jgi:PhnB protein